MGAPSFFSELKRRQIYRGGVMYVVAGWVIVQVATTVFPYFSIPPWAIRLVVVAILLGFPIALVALWMFESTIPDPESRLHDRRQIRDSTDALAKLMESQRAERQRETQQLIAAMGQLKAGVASSQEEPAPIVSVAAVRAEQAPASRSAYERPRRKSRIPVLLGVLALCIVISGVWMLVSPQAVLQPGAMSTQLAENYMVPGFKQVERVGVWLLTPVLHKIGLHVAPDRVFTVLMVIFAFLVLRNFYRQMVRSRVHDAGQH